MEMLLARDDDDAFALKRKLRKATNLLSQVYEHDRSTAAQLERVETNWRELKVSISMRSQFCFNGSSIWRVS